MKRWLVILSIVTLGFFVIGCLGSKTETQVEPEQAETGETSSDETSDSSEVVSEFFEILSAYDMATLFQELEYSYIGTTPDGDSGTRSYSFIVLDEQKIDGTHAYQISFSETMKDHESVLECWVSGNEVLKGSSDGEPMEEIDLMMANAKLSSFVAPYALIGIMEAVITNSETRDLLGWEMLDEGTVSGDLGDESLTFRYYELQSNENEYAYYEVATVAGKNIFANYKFTNRDGRTNELNTTKLISN